MAHAPSLLLLDDLDAWMPAAPAGAAGASPAYPVGDKTQINSQMTDADALDPIPNAIFFNWVATARVRVRVS